VDRICVAAAARQGRADATAADASLIDTRGSPPGEACASQREREARDGAAPEAGHEERARHDSDKPALRVPIPGVLCPLPHVGHSAVLNEVHGHQRDASSKKKNCNGYAPFSMLDDPKTRLCELMAFATGIGHGRYTERRRAQKTRKDCTLLMRGNSFSYLKLKND
jgi:hypothetical protein